MGEARRLRGASGASGASVLDGAESVACSEAAHTADSHRSGCLESH
jgi:hypothetical protein